ncbi:C4-dicarboxylate ABC transporter permease [Marispirochaeta aestuarii]|uniref:C4-dicarboxylate ABC transporter permease n=1 Tax=Marispirochaeta aestuarii TaxID=1963862 RepID=A0A1Y1S386_9SPIO|nr:TRAP transporter large permease [Marispirochaeta aestuarii]ORC38429.1 C4-dicarboxylate ABC transporter permease [Marispirochaeta aestuarii]
MALVFSSFIILMLLNVPIAFVLGISSLIYFLFFGNIPLAVIGQKLYTGTDNYVLLAIPFFVLAGELMNRTRITDDLVSFAKALVGRIPGALAQVNIVTSIFFAGLTGAAVADTAAIGSLLIPAMKKEGYSPEYAAAVTTTSSIIGPIIPPSIIVVIYATATMESVGALFIGGFVPGLLIGLGLMLVALLFALKYKHPRRKTRMPARELYVTTKNSLLGLLCPLIIVGGILSGVFTPTEAAAVACAYALIVGVFVFRNLSLKDIIASFGKSAITSGVILLIITTATLFSTVLTIEKIPEALAEFMVNLTTNKYMFLLIINVFLLFMGMILETGANVILLAPILLPIAQLYGINSLHFALIMLVNLNIGLTTPPLGVCLFTAAPIAGVRFEKIARAAMPFIGIEIVVLLMITYLPDMVLFLPRITGYL